MRQAVADRVGVGACIDAHATDSQVDWVSPRPLWEFASNISIPKNQTKWTSRLKCNAYYYRANYLGLLLVCALVTLFRQPLALLGVLLLAAAAMTLNDPAVTAAK